MTQHSQKPRTLNCACRLDTTPVKGGVWSEPIVKLGVQAVIETASDFALLRDLSGTDTNILSAIGNEVSKRLRAKILLGQLEATGWNLTHAAERLRLGDVTHALRAIRVLGLTEDYEKAKASGKILRGGRRARVQIPGG